eukprot:COSAG02_NODE_11605_length_1690_cov_8.552264_1_plen_84_part_00
MNKFYQYVYAQNGLIHRSEPDLRTDRKWEPTGFWTVPGQNRDEKVGMVHGRLAYMRQVADSSKVQVGMVHNRRYRRSERRACM